MKYKCRGLIDQKRRFILQDLQNECVWFFSFDQIKDLLMQIDLDEKITKDKKKK